MTDNEKLWRQAARKVKAAADKTADEIPLFADQVELPTVEEAYWDIRRGWALVPRGEGAAELARVDGSWDVYVIRLLAARVMSQRDYAAAVSKEHAHGSRLDFWKSILTGRRRLVLSCWRHVHGVAWNKPSPYYSGPPFLVEKRVDCGEAIVWPPDGWQPPFSAGAIEELLRVPPPYDHPEAVNPLNLR